MAVGDFFRLYNQGTSDWEIQPPEHEVWMITAVRGPGGGNAALSAINPTLYPYSNRWIMSLDYGSKAFNPYCRIIIDHENYLRVYFHNEHCVVEGYVLKDESGYMQGIKGVVIGWCDQYVSDQVRPPAGEEWLITSVSHDIWNNWHMHDGTDNQAINFQSFPSQNAGLITTTNLSIRVTNDLYLYATQELAFYCGFVTKLAP